MTHKERTYKIKQEITKPKPKTEIDSFCDEWNLTPEELKENLHLQNSHIYPTIIDANHAVTLVETSQI